METPKIPVYSVYDNFRHSPLALGSILSYARDYKSGALTNVYNYIPLLLTSTTGAMPIVESFGSGIILCSNYLWTGQNNLKLAKALKERYPRSVTIVGGPSVPKFDYSCRTFFEQHPYVDIAVHGEGEATTAELLEKLVAGSASDDRTFLSNIAGITYRQKSISGRDEVVSTGDRERIQDLGSLPSPYLTNWFRSEDARKWDAAIIETNRGCPYGCTFCDWGSATRSKVRHFPVERVENEIEWIARHGISKLWIADANFGMFDRDINIASTIASCRKKHGYPEQVIVNYAKKGTDRISEIVGILRSADIATQGIISIQTTDPQTLENVKRSNIRTEQYEELIQIFRKNELPVSSDLMIGLPGSTIETFKTDIQFFFDRQVYAKAYSTVVLPNSPMAHRDYIDKFGIKTDQSGMIVSTSSYTRYDKFIMSQIYFCYRFLIGFSVLKSFLYYLQMDHEIPAIHFISDLHRTLSEKSTSLDEVRKLWTSINMIDHNEWERTLRQRTPDEWGNFYKEIASYVSARYGIKDPAMATVLLVQEKLTPRGAQSSSLFEKLDLSYDFGAYFRQIESVRNLSEIRQTGMKRLQEFGPGVLAISELAGPALVYSPLVDK